MHALKRDSQRILPRMWPTRRLVAMVLVSALTANAYAANRRWNNGTGSFVFNTPGNWQGGGTAPGVLDVAQFGISVPLFPAGAYTVIFNNNATNQALHIEDDSVTFNISSRVYTLSAATGMVIGNQSNSWAGSLTITNGTISGSGNFDVGAAANRSGTLVVGVNGIISGSPSLNIGKLGTGTVTVQEGGDISTTGTTTIGDGDGITATATVFGDGSTLVTGALNVGSIGDGTVDVQFGGLLQSNGGARLGTGSLFTGTGIGIVNVMNAGSIWNSLGLLEIGDGGSGKVNITLGGKVTGVNTKIGSLSAGEVIVNGPSSLWDSSGTLTIGELGAGTLNITNQGIVENEDGFIGSSSTSTSIGTVTVNGVGSRWTNTSDLTVGNAGTGTLNITGGGHVQNNFAYVGRLSSGTGHVTVDGVGSRWDPSDSLLVGDQGEGTLSITAGGHVDRIFPSIPNGIVGNGSTGTGHVTVNGDQSSWFPWGLTVGGAGHGTLEITGGGNVFSRDPGSFFDGDFVGHDAGSAGLVTVEGDGSNWFSELEVNIGHQGDGTLEIIGGGKVQFLRDGIIGALSGGTGHVTVDGDGSGWDLLILGSGRLYVGSDGQGTLGISGGGTVQNISGRIGWGASGTGLVTVDGDGSQWHNADSLTVGNAGTGTLEITDGGSVTTDSDAFIGENEDSTGTVTVAGAGSIWQIGGRLDIGYDASSLSNGGVGILHIQPGGTVNATQGTAVSLGDQLNLEGGTLSTAQISFPGGGSADTNFEWTSGTLHVISFDGDLVNSAGVLAPGNSIGVTSIQGNYNQLADATLEIHVGGTTQGSQYDFVRVHGNAILGGDLELALVNGFVPGSANTFTILHDDLDLFSAFANVANGQRLSTSNGLGSFLVNYGPGSAFDPDQIVLSAFLLGDYNGDGTVNAADYVVWRKNDGTQAGYDTWRANFGRTAGSGLGTSANAGVPEPATVVLLIAGLLTFCSRRRTTVS